MPAKEKRPEATPSRTAKDSVFCDLFSHRDNVLQLYRDLHPEDEGAKEEDVEVVTLDRMLTRGQYNDLGFTVRGRIVVLVEAQSTWSVNIVVRMLFYLADTYRRHMAERGRSVYSTTAVSLPRPELLVVYTGSDKNDPPDELLFTRDVLGSPDSSVEVRVRVVKPGAEGILGEYVEFALEFDRQRKALGPTLAAVEATIDACVGRGVLKRYLEGRREEVIDMMHSMLDREEALAVFLQEENEETRRVEREKVRLQSIANLANNLSMSHEQAMDALGIPECDRPSLLEELRNKR